MKELKFEILDFKKLRTDPMFMEWICKLTDRTREGRSLDVGSGNFDWEATLVNDGETRLIPDITTEDLDGLDGCVGAAALRAQKEYYEFSAPEVGQTYLEIEMSRMGYQIQQIGLGRGFGQQVQGK